MRINLKFTSSHKHKTGLCTHQINRYKDQQQYTSKTLQRQKSMTNKTTDMVVTNLKLSACKLHKDIRRHAI